MTGMVDREVRQDVADVLVRYAAAIDLRDWDMLASCFTEDCDADYGAIGQWTNVGEIVQWMRDTHEPVGQTLHRITNQLVLEHDGDVVRSRAYVDAVVMFPDGKTGTNAVGHYDDELVRVDGSWRIAKRRFTTVLLRWIPDGTIFELGG